MNQTIFLLDEQTVNQIAAGEVVERPSSVVKELIENAIDAQASSVVIETKEGGKASIRITDNGSGIQGSQLKKAFMPHATSKIKSMEDLNSLTSNGFRGEALSSIASVSKVTLLSKTQEALLGRKVYVEQGEILQEDEVGTQLGTSIIVEELFCNIPVRKKFLKSASSENMAIHQIILQLALAHPEVKYKWISEGKLALQTPGNGDLIHTLRMVYGKSFSEQMILVEREEEGVTIRGVISKPSLYFPNRRKQSLFINKRYVQHSAISRSVEDAYKGVLPIGKFPSYILFLEIHPSALDVNIHPSKMEVKIDHSLKTEDRIYSCVRETLFQKPENIIPTIPVESFQKKEDKEEKEFIQVQFSLSKEETYAQESASRKYFQQLQETQKLEEASSREQHPSTIAMDRSAEGIARNDINKGDAKGGLDYETDISQENKRVGEGISRYDIKKGEEALEAKEAQSRSTIYMSPGDARGIQAEVQLPKEDSSLSQGMQEDRFASPQIRESCPVDPKEHEKEGENGKDLFSMEALEIVGRIFETYILATHHKSFYIMDQHAAHERVLYERYLDMYYRRSVDTQMLLGVETLEMDYEDMQTVEENFGFFEDLGFEIETFGHRSVLVKGVPILFNQNQQETFLYEVIELIRREKKIGDMQAFKDRIAGMACKKAIKAHDSMELVEIHSLLQQLNQCSEKYTCPHGRPIFVEFRQYDLEKLFKRVNP